MTRLVIVLSVICVFVLAGCTAGGGRERESERVSPKAQSAQTGGQAPGTVDESGRPAPATPLSTDDQSRLAQELLRKGDVEAAIAILEDLAAQEPLREDLVPMLVDAHTRYAQMIAMNRHASPEALNHVLYSHYMRILELEPENLEAQAGLQSVKMWFESHGMTLPEQVDPILFLPKTGDESAEDETDGTEGEGSSEEDQ